jgi:hypothetical protein
MARFFPLLALCLAFCLADAFAPSSSQRAAQASALFAFFGSTKKASSSTKRPTLNPKTNRWEAAPGDDGIYPYDAVGSLLRHGPSPFFTRLTNPDEYEQAVLKYMATANVDRAEATGNMDAKLNNALDWAFRKGEERKGAPKVDYTMLNKKQAALVIIWAVFITPLAASVVLDTVTQFLDPNN